MVLAALESLDDTGELLLEDLDALLHNLVGLQSSHGFHVVEEAGGFSVVIEGFALLRISVDLSISHIDGPSGLISALFKRSGFENRTGILTILFWGPPHTNNRGGATCY